MKILITGSAGLVGSEAVKFYKDHEIIGIDNYQRSKWFGTEKIKIEQENYTHNYTDISNYEQVERVFTTHGPFDYVLAAAAQPSHDFAAQIPIEDFEVNARGAINLLEATRQHSPESVFIQVSTNKVYGDRPNYFEYTEDEKRLIPTDINILSGFDEDLNIDQCTHSLFGVSKLYGDVIAQEYGKYFGLKVGVFRGGCLTGSAHQGAKLHGFLNYLVKCAKYEIPYEIIGYGGKQVRDNIHAYDLITAFEEFRKNPRPGEVYNIGGGAYSNCSVLEAVEMCEKITGKKMKIAFNDTPRIGDHKWYISDVSKFKFHYPNWKYTYNIQQIIKEIYENV
jgi:CDP-paratose 2-epimerase